MLQFNSSCLHGFIISFCLWGLVVLLFCSPWEEWYLWYFLSEIFKLFPRQNSSFRRFLIFCTFCLKSWGFEIAPARGSLASVLGHVMTSWDYTKVEQVRTWLLRSRILNVFFSTLPQLILSGYMVHVEFLPLGSCGSFVLFSMRWLDFSFFLVWNFQTVFR